MVSHSEAAANKRDKSLFAASHHVLAHTASQLLQVAIKVQIHLQT